MSGAAPAAAQLESGEILLLPTELWAAVDEATEIAAVHQDPIDARTAFGVAFAAALHRRGLILVARARSNTRESVTADLYSLALSGKYAAERLLKVARNAEPVIDALTKLLLGEPEVEAMASPLLDDLGAGLLALVGRAPPDDRRRIWRALIRLRATAAILNGQSASDAPPLEDKLVEFLQPAADDSAAGAGEAIR